MLNRRTGNLFLVLLFAFIGTFIFAQDRSKLLSTKKPGAAAMKAGNFIDVNAASYPESSYNITNLVKNVLISGGNCVSTSVSNVVVSPNLAASNPNRSWGFLIRQPPISLLPKGLCLRQVMPIKQEIPTSLT